MKATVLIRPKEGILDPQGEAVGDALRTLGFAVSGARVGRLVDVELDDADPAEAQAALESMARDLLANPLIESFTIELGSDRIVSDGPRYRGRHVPRLERRRGRSARARVPRRRARSRLACGRSAAGGNRGRDPARRLLLRRLPPLRRDRPLRAGDGVGERVRGRGRPGARHLQRLPDPLRGGAAAGRAAPQSPAAVPLRRRDGDGREHDERLRRQLVGGRGARDPDQARRGQLVRRRRPACLARGQRADRVPLHARTSTAPSTGSRASRTRPATSSA